MHSPEPKRADVDQSSVAIDPVCGMTVVPAAAAGTHEYKGKTYYFCSQHCLHKFQNDPESFLNKPAATLVQPIGIQPRGRSFCNRTNR